MAMTTTAAPPIDITVWAARSNAARKAIRTALQVLVALTPPLLLMLTGLLSPTAALTVAAALTPVAAFAQNLLEDNGLIGTWLRRPTPEGTVSIVSTVREYLDVAADTPDVGEEGPEYVVFDQDDDDDDLLDLPEYLGEPRYSLIRRQRP